ncbi:hypothetical protein BJX99DRAFT_267560 [Aspergillus californicus]
MPPNLDNEGTTGSRPFKCAKCSKCYTKLEHLNRHERTHTNSKPYRCNECGRRFGRQDVLSRHVKLHLDGQSRLGASSTQEPPELFFERQPETDQSMSGLAFPSGAVPTPPDDIPPHTTFEDSDDLLDWLMAGFNDNPILPLPFTDIPGVDNQVLQPDHDSHDDPNHLRYGSPETMGIQHLFKLINDMSRRLSSDIDNKRITSDFLDTCLHEYFERVSPTFPVIHRPTFSSQKTIPPLLLNMVALGSLFVCLPDAVQKGELLWRLGHTAVSTSWRTLIQIRGPHDICDGVQLVLTALLGQTYALLSSNNDIQTTAFVVHGLGFYWARTSGMYSMKDIQTAAPDIHPRESDKRLEWERWAAQEVQRRAVLGHYILDGLISQASGSPSSARHLINRIGSACSDTAFAASTVDDWISELMASPNVQQPMSEILAIVLTGRHAQTPLKLSSFSIAVVIEGFQSLISEAKEVTGDPIGVVTRQQIIGGLLSLSKHLPPFSASKTTIRLHNVCIEVVAPTTSLWRALCDTFALPRLLLTSAAIPVEDLNLTEWVKGADATRALLHALAILRLLHQIPFSNAHAPHLPAAIFSSALVISSVCLSGTTTVDAPQSPQWEDVHGLMRVLRESGRVTSVNLVNELNFLQLALRTMTSCYGISAQMENIVGLLMGLVRERQAAGSGPGI